MTSTPRIISLLTDFGTQDGFVGIMKGVVLGINPSVSIVDLSHDVPPQDILMGALILRSAIGFFSPGTIHVAVVDPGVGSTRRALIVETAAAFLVGPDNGLLSLAAPPESVRRVVHLTNSRYFPPHVSRTFHGRDIFAPVAAHLSRGVPSDDFGPVVTAMERLTLPIVAHAPHRITGSVIAIDRFGNIVTNITAADVLPYPTESLSVSIGPVQIHGLTSTYAAVPVGAATALLNSWGMLEIAVRNGSAAQQLGVQRGAAVLITDQ
ncbi:MAG: SAM-dependent chlorinase/fluorinase [Deltaproteobacteria bacterium]|nr:SAM-dependent chlorinase/fluorinase [Deltaproteobacteria bacterium]